RPGAGVAAGLAGAGLADDGGQVGREDADAPGWLAGDAAVAPGADGGEPLAAPDVAQGALDVVEHGPCRVVGDDPAWLVPGGAPARVEQLARVLGQAVGVRQGDAEVCCG